MHLAAPAAGTFSRLPSTVPRPPPPARGGSLGSAAPPWETAWHDRGGDGSGCGGGGRGGAVQWRFEERCRRMSGVGLVAANSVYVDRDAAAAAEGDGAGSGSCGVCRQDCRKVQ
jgi:hypothetical protein